MEIDKLAVIGLGRTGPPLAAAFAAAGLPVAGIDRQPRVVDAVGRGRVPPGLDRPGLADALRRTTADGTLRATTDWAFSADCDAAVIAVGTGWDEEAERPDTRDLREAARLVGEHLTSGDLVVVASTVAPGTCEGEVLPLLRTETRRQFHLAHVPPGPWRGPSDRDARLVAGGLTEEAADRAAALYSIILEEPPETTDLASSSPRMTTGSQII